MISRKRPYVLQHGECLGRPRPIPRPSAVQGLSPQTCTSPALRKPELVQRSEKMAIWQSLILPIIVTLESLQLYY